MRNKKPAVFILFFLGVIMAGCQHKPAPTSSEPMSGKPLITYADPDKDTNNVIVNKKMVDGLNIIKYKDGIVKAKGYSRAGKKYGEWQSFYETGALRSDEFFTDGVSDGKVTVWYDNGQKWYEGEYKSGKLVGVWNHWDKKGKLLRTSDYNKESQNTAL